MIQSTKPFRRAGALVLANTYLLFMAAFFWGCHTVAKLTHSNFVVNKLETPTTFRAYRLLRARDIKKRELEHKMALRREEIYREETIQKELDAHKHVIFARTQLHQRALEAFDDELYADDRAREAEEKKRQAAELAAAKQAELAAFTAAEIKRQEEYKANRVIEMQLEREARLAELKERELHYYRSTKDDESSYGDRFVSVHGVYIRKLPHTESKILANLKTGERVSVDGWINSEVHWNNGIWFRLTANQNFPHGGWMWSGSLNNQSTSGLRNLNEHRETNEIRSFDGSACYIIEEPTQMERLIEAEKQENNKKNRHFYQSQAPTTDLQKGDIWFDKSRGNKASVWDGTRWERITIYDMTKTGVVPNDVQSITRNGITAEKINANIITASKIQVGDISISAAGGLQAPNFTQYNIPDITPVTEREMEIYKKVKRDSLQETAELLLKQKRKQQRDEDERRVRDANAMIQQANMNAMNTAVAIAIGAMN